MQKDEDYGSIYDDACDSEVPRFRNPHAEREDFVTLFVHGPVAVAAARYFAQHADVR